uniref:C6 domain-containing protein n=2 Tax=Caenorhabditis tropicalis TaxID=1561998 RepID=A0A1I7UVI3_9PELO
MPEYANTFLVFSEQERMKPSSRENENSSPFGFKTDFRVFGLSEGVLLSRSKMNILICFVSIIFLIKNTVDTCFATSAAQGAVVTTTEDPVELRTCSPTALTLGTANSADLSIDVNYINLVSTRIGTTLETDSTMQLTCTASEGLRAFMSFNDTLTAAENVPNPRTVTVNLTCNSEEMVWYYVTTYEGINYRYDITMAVCAELAIPTDPG